jgi:Raf kinase inhibitor-like YbhB/YbcL family protein
MKGRSTLTIFAKFATAILCLASVDSVLAQELFELRSPAFEDNGKLQTKNAGKNPNVPSCIGDNVSPPLSWSGVPTGTKSLVALMYDQQGMNGLGVSHLVVYGIEPSLTGFAEGELGSASDKFVGGKNTLGTTVYIGPCPARGTGQHHYVITLIATDLDRSALAPGLTREELLRELKGHAKGAAGTVARFESP